MNTAAQFYWDGIDHEDLHCVCGTPYPTFSDDPAHPDNDDHGIATCDKCGAVADLTFDHDDLPIWIVRKAVL